MSRIFKTIIIVAAIIFIPIYLFYAIGFGLQLMGFVEAIESEGFRDALSAEGSGDIAFYADITWLGLMIISIYIIPLILILSGIVYLIRKKRKRT